MSDICLDLHEAAPPSAMFGRWAPRTLAQSVCCYFPRDRNGLDKLTQRMDSWYPPLQKTQGWGSLIREIQANMEEGKAGQSRRKIGASLGAFEERLWKRMRSGDRPGLQNRRAAGFPVTGGFDPHSLPPFFEEPCKVNPPGAEAHPVFVP